MQIEFKGSPGPSLGVEVELELIDVRSGQLASAASDILEELGRGYPGGVHPKAKHELFECCIEVITGVCATVAEARADLEATIAEVRTAASRRGLTLICSGSHPFSHWGDQTISPDPRYHELVGEMQWMARRLQIFGVHVHVGVRTGEKAVRIAGALSRYIPHLLALSASSPFWEGHDTGLASARSKVFEGLPTAGLPARLHSWGDFEEYMGTLVAADAISTVREVWWDIRPHPDFGTVELRMCDGLPSLGEVAAVAALAQSLVHHLDALDDRGALPEPPRTWVLTENKWRAGRHGLEAALIGEQVDGAADEGAGGAAASSTASARHALAHLADELAPVAAELGCAAELAAVHRTLRAGASYERQRRASDGGTNLWAVVDQLARELATDVIEP